MEPLLKIDKHRGDYCKYWRVMPLFAWCFLLVINGCSSNSLNCYLSSSFPDKIFTIKRDRCINFGSWDMVIDGDIEDYYLYFDYGFCYVDKSYQIKVCCVNAYAQIPDEIIVVNMYEIIKELLYAKSNIKPELSAKDIASIALEVFNGNDVVEYETKYAKGFIYRYPYSKNQILVDVFSKDSLNGFSLILTKLDANTDEITHEEYAFKLASSIRFSDKPRLNESDFKDIFNKMYCYDSVNNEEEVIIKLTRYYLVK